MGDLSIFDLVDDNEANVCLEYVYVLYVIPPKRVLSTSILVINLPIITFHCFVNKTIQVTFF